MIFDEKTVDDIQRLINAGQVERLRQLPLEGLTVGGLTELLCRGWEWSQVPEMSSIFRSWRQQSVILDAAWRDLLLGRTNVSSSLSPVSWDFMCLPSPTSPGNAWSCFFKRFELSLRENGFSTDLARALARAAREMAENVWNHSGDTDETPARGVIAYYVEDRVMAYAVADVGRGILSSLQSGGKGEDLLNSRDALEAAIQQNRTRRTDFEQGQGFNWVFRSLADLNGVLRFRTGDAALHITGKAEQRNFDYRPSPTMLGFQLSIHCSPASDSLPIHRL